MGFFIFGCFLGSVWTGLHELKGRPFTQGIFLLFVITILIGGYVIFSTVGV